MAIKKQTVTQIGSRLPKGTSGSVIFVDSNLKIAQDNSNLFWDNGNKRLGIGTDTPVGRLHVLDGPIYVGDGTNVEFPGSALFVTSSVDTNTDIILRAAGPSNTSILRADRYKGTFSSRSKVESGDIVFKFLGGGWDGGALRFTAGIEMTVDGATSSGNIPQKISFFTGETTSRTERLTIKSDGKVGIGTETPDNGLQVVNNITIGKSGLGLTPVLDFKGTGQLIIQRNGAAILQGASGGNNATRIFTVGTERMTFTGAGLTGLGELLPETFFEMTSDEPYLTLHNSTHEDTDGGRESRIIFKGEQSGGEESTLGRLEISHDGTSDDQKGKFTLALNDGDDSDAPTTRITVASDGLTTVNGTISTGGVINRYIKATGFISNQVGRNADFGSSDVGFYADSGGDLQFVSGGNTDIMILESGGNVGIGEINPQERLHVNGATRLDGDLFFVGAGSGLPYGEIYVKDNTVATTLNSTGGKVQIDKFNTDGVSNNTTPSHAQDHIQIDHAGVYKVTCSMGISNEAGASHLLDVSIWKNNGGTELTNIHCHRTMAAGTDHGSITLTGLVDLSVDDTIELWANTDRAVNTDVEFEDITLSLIQIGG